MNLKTLTTSIGLTLWLAQPSLTHAQSTTPPAAEFKVANAKPGELRIMSSGAFAEILNAVHEQAQKTVGRPVVIQYGSARGNLQREILAGQDFEVAILLPEVNAELLKQDRIWPERYELGRVKVGISLRGDAANVDVSTPAALKTTLLNARSVKYSSTGTSLPTVQKVLSALGIADAIKDSSKLLTAVELKPGEYEINFFVLSEVSRNTAYKNLGPVIPEFQVPVIVEAAIGKHANDKAAAEALIKFLRGPAMAPALAKGGLTAGAH